MPASPPSPNSPQPTRPTAPTHHILFTIPRTASNLLSQLLNLPSQPNILRHPEDGYFLLPALQYRYQHNTFTRPFTSLSREESEGLSDALQTSCKAWEEWVETAENERKGTYVKEHVNWMISPCVESDFLHPSHPSELGFEKEVRNPTAIPDDFLLSGRVRPTFLIRHPALTFPSLLRTAIDNEGLDEVLKEGSAMAMRCECTYTWHIQLNQFLVASDTYPCASHVESITYPIIIDAADLKDEELVRRYAQAVGLDSGKVRFAWKEAGKEGLGITETRMKDTILASKGVLAGKLQSGE
jgi:hypothetical protein